MRSKIKIFGLILLVLLNVKIVNASSTCSIELNSHSASQSFKKKTGIDIEYKGSKKAYGSYQLYTENKGGEALTAYCRNPGLDPAIDFSSNQVFACSDVLLDPTEDNIKTKSYEAGVVAILKNGYSNQTDKSITGDADVDYAITNLAIRVYELLWPTFNESTDSKDITKAHRYYVNEWWSDIESLIKELDEKGLKVRKNKYTDNEILKVTNWYVDGKKDTSIVSNAKELLKKGLIAARDYDPENEKSLTWNEEPLTSKPIKDDTSNTYETTLVYNFLAKNFTEANEVIKLKFNCENCTNKANYVISVNGEVINNPTEFFELKVDNTQKENKYELKIVFTSLTSYDCEDLKYNINVEYKNELMQMRVYSVRHEKLYGSSQGYYVLKNEQSGNGSLEGLEKATITDTVELCNLSCVELKEACETKGIGCDVFKNKYGGECPNCTAYISQSYCDSEEDNEFDIKEGYKKDNNNTCVEGEGFEEDIKACIIKENSADAEGNKYNDPNLIASSNPYCQVFCKEDYHFTLPGIKEVNSGRYFTLQGTIEGKKTCFTNEINSSAFQSDLEKARKKIIDAYNNYIRTYWLVNEEWNQPHPRDVEYNLKVNEECEWITNTFTNEDGITYQEQERVCKCVTESTAKCQIASKTITYNKYNYSGGASKFTETVQFGGATDAPCPGTGSCTSYEEDLQKYTNELGTMDVDSYFTSIDPTKGNVDYSTHCNGLVCKLSGAIANFKSILYKYNSCSGYSEQGGGEMNSSPFKYGWKIEYEYDPELSFWYEESYMNNVLTDTLETIGDVSVDKQYKQTSCTGEVNNKYECISGDKKDNENNGVLSSVSIPTATESKFMCKKKSGLYYECGWYSYTYSTAKYVKQEKNSKGEYITPTQFYTIYPSGSIVVGKSGQEDIIENSKELKNALPVGLGTPQGVYNYILKVKDLGEYYDKEFMSQAKEDRLGRIWDDNKDTVVVNTLKEHEACYINPSTALTNNVTVNGKYYTHGIYLCAYKVNCPDCPVVCDPEGCINNNCPDGDCPVECDNCIYTNGMSNVIYRPITPGDLNPNDRDLGKNWEFDGNIDTAIEFKAAVTTTEIEKNGESIYDVNYDNVNKETDFAMKIKLDSKMINAIKTYNKEQESKGGYANDTLKCYDHVNSNDGKTYKNVYCYSTFIDYLLYNRDLKDNIEINKNRIIGDDESSSNNLRKSNTQSSGYWKTWSEENNHYSGTEWTINTTKILEFKKNYYDIGIGPSWK